MTMQTTFRHRLQSLFERTHPTHGLLLGIILAVSIHGDYFSNQSVQPSERLAQKSVN